MADEKKVIRLIKTVAGSKLSVVFVVDVVIVDVAVVDVVVVDVVSFQNFEFQRFLSDILLNFYFLA